MISSSAVVILPDNDEGGREHAEMVARSLNGHAARIRVVHLVEDMPTLPVKKDVSYWLDAGRTVEHLHDLVDRATAWRPKVVTHLPVIWFGDEDAAPPLSWLVKGLLVDGGISAVYGGPGASKSFLVLDLALHIARGKDWFGRRVRQGAVLYVSGEGASGMILRMKAWGKEKGDGTRVPLGLISSSVNLFDDETGAGMLIDDVKARAAELGQPIRLVVLDTLSRMIGSGDEDKARDINMVVQRAERIQRETGAHVLIVHHSGKDRDRGMRGSNALLGAADAVIEVSRHEESGLCEGKIVKVKDGSADAPFKYTLRQSVLWVDEEGEDITSAVVEPTDASPGVTRGGPKLKLTPAERIALDALDEALIDHGVVQPIASVPNGGRAVSIETWRKRAYGKGVAEGTDDAKRQAFFRVRQTLTVKKLVGIEGDWAWKG
jgi:KaiC/GvpD/RAD55 family RecA-like ATPase